jgi:hypothetical protein
VTERLDRELENKCHKSLEKPVELIMSCALEDSQRIRTERLPCKSAKASLWMCFGR